MRLFKVNLGILGSHPPSGLKFIAKYLQIIFYAVFGIQKMAYPNLYTPCLGIAVETCMCMGR